MNPHKRPMPADFLEVAPTMGIKELYRHYRVGEVALDRWITESGMVRPAKWERVAKYRPMPEGFAEDAARMNNSELVKKYKASARKICDWRAELGGIKPEKRGPVGRPPHPDFTAVCMTMTRAELANHFCVTVWMIDSWYRKSGLTPPQRHAAVPDNFHQIAPYKTRNECMALWDVSLATLTRWIKETGVEPKPAKRGGAMQRPQTAFGYSGVFNAPRRDTFASIAADTLRRNRWVVHQCDEKGRYDPKGTFWRVGRVVVTEGELLQRAAKYEAIAA